MKILIMASFVLVVGCSADNSTKMMNLRNENTNVSNLSSNATNKNTQYETLSTMEYETPKKLNCNDPDRYRLAIINNPSRADSEHEGDFIPKDVNILVGNSVIGRIEVPTASVVKNFSLNSLEKSKEDFVIDADWGGWQNHYQLKYFFVCKDGNFFFSKILLNRVAGKDPGDPKNWEKTEMNVDPAVPLEKFSILDYLGNE